MALFAAACAPAGAPEPPPLMVPDDSWPTAMPEGIPVPEFGTLLETSDDHYIYVRGQGTGIDSTDVRTVLEFEAPNDSPWDWLHSGKFVARRSVDAEAAALEIAVYDVSAVEAANTNEGIVRIDKAGDLPEQPRDYRVAGDGET